MNNQSSRGGLWNSQRPTISSETQNLLKGYDHFNAIFTYFICLLIFLKKFSNDARV